MKVKQLVVLGLGVVIGGGLSIAGLSYASANNNSQVSNLISEEQAKSIMMKKVPGATIQEFEFDQDDNKYDGTLVKDNYEYDVDVNAKTGDIVGFEKEVIDGDDLYDDKYDDDMNDIDDNDDINDVDDDNSVNNAGNTDSYIGEEKAKSIMMEKVPGATIREFELDNDSTPEYEAELVDKNFEYDITVDAKTGKIAEFNKEAINQYDNVNNK